MSTVPCIGRPVRPASYPPNDSSPHDTRHLLPWLLSRSRYFPFFNDPSSIIVSVSNGPPRLPARAQPWINAPRFVFYNLVTSWQKAAQSCVPWDLLNLTQDYCVFISIGGLATMFGNAQYPATFTRSDFIAAARGLSADHYTYSTATPTIWINPSDEPTEQPPGSAVDGKGQTELGSRIYYVKIPLLSNGRPNVTSFRKGAANGMPPYLPPTMHPHVKGTEIAKSKHICYPPAPTAGKPFSDASFCPQCGSENPDGEIDFCECVFFSRKGAGKPLVLNCCTECSRPLCHAETIRTPMRIKAKGIPPDFLFCSKCGNREGYCCSTEGFNPPLLIRDPRLGPA